MSVIAGSHATTTAAPPLAEAVGAVLWLWDSLGLEIGDTAVVTDGHPWARLAAFAATLYGARTVFVSKVARSVPPHVRYLHWTGADENTRELAGLLKGAPGVVAAELSGEAGLVDLVLETVPPSSRVMLAGLGGDRLTIDFYQNVHIKGLHLVSGTLEAASHSPVRVGRVQRLLARPAIAAVCGEMLEPRNAPGSR